MQRSFIYYFFAPIFFSGCMVVLSCNITEQKQKQQQTQTAVAINGMDSFTVEVQPYKLQNPLPGLQSFAWAISGNKLLLIGGRIEGYHGLPQNDSVFRTSRANKSIFVIDLSDFSYTSLALNTNDSSLLQLFASDFEFCQDNDTLYIVGGYGIQHVNNSQSNYTFGRMVSIQVSTMIQQVARQNNGNINLAITGVASSSFLRVTGGEMCKQNGKFFLMFGQNYKGIYQPGINGIYTSSIRSFRLANNQLADASSYIDTTLHRRDLTLAPVIQNNNSFYAAFGGVFTPDDNGYMNPIYIDVNNPSISVKQDTLMQLTSQYTCAFATIFDSINNSCSNVLFGGIGRYEYDTASKKWLDGDNHAKLPFVNSITQLTYQNSVMHQHVQIPPGEPIMPGFVGADAIFIPNSKFVTTKGVINYNLLPGGKNFIGYIFGGISSIKPTSSIIYPTKVNNVLYAVYLNKY